MAATPIRSLRVPDDLWASWQKRATKAGVSVSVLIRAAMEPDEVILGGGLLVEREDPPGANDLEGFSEAFAAEIDTGEGDTQSKVGTKPRAAGPTASRGAQPPPPCRHPKKFREVKPYATFCSTELGGCGARV